MFAGCPLIWTLKLQTKITFSSTQVEYIALSTATRDTIPLLDFLKEAKRKEIPINTHDAEIHCKIFEDYSVTIQMAKVPKMHRQTKHLNIKYHHF
jgi:hypothetical protein